MCIRDRRAPVQPTLETNAKTAVLPIACYPWGGTYRPAAWAQCGLDGESLHLLLWCQEDNRDKPRYLHDNEPVYTDSCLEAVSYTHLDVYKRQGLGNPSEPLHRNV